MSLLAVFRPAPLRQPGRHSVEWAAMQQGLAALTQRCRAFEAAAATLQTKLDEQTEQHALEVEGWQEALDHTSAEYAALLRVYERLDTNCIRLRADNERLQQVLSASDGQTGTNMTAAADLPGSCFNEHDPAPLPAFRIGADIPPGPVGEAADVNTRTQPVDMRALRAEMDEAQAQPRPVLPNELARSEAMTVSTPVMTLSERGGLVKFSKPKTSLIRVAPVASERAHESVEAAVGAAP